MSQTSYNNEDALLAKKVEKLLEDDTTENLVHPNERKLTALVLLTRMNDTELEHIWQAYPQLSTFAAKLVEEHPDTPVYARLTARLLSRLSATSPSVDSLGCNLLSVLERRRTSMSIQLLDLEIVDSLHTWLLSNQNWNVVEERLQQIWRLYSAQPSLSSDNEEPHNHSTDAVKEAYETMVQTLTALLDQDSNFKEEGDDLIDSWHEQVTRLILKTTLHLIQNSQRIPTIWTTILEWWIHHSAQSKLMSVESRRSWAQVLLLSAQSLTTWCRQSLEQRLSQDTALATNLARLVQTCVVSVETSDQLRGIAWSTMADLIESCGWDWLLAPTSSNASSTSLGWAHTICTLIRMAAGEWKIQLGLVLHADPQTALEEEKTLLTQACAQVLVHAVDYVVGLAEQSETGALPLSIDAIMHLRQSLEESLDSAVQYLGLSERRISDIDVSVVRVLAALLAEFDVFEQKRSRKEEESNENEKLQALRVALEIQNVEAHEHLMPCLASVFAAAEGDEMRVSLLEEYGLLGDSFLKFMEDYWKTTTSLSSIPWACQAIETWSSLSKVSETSQLLSWLIEWIQRALTQSPCKELVSSMSSVIGCYVTLHGDNPPEEPDSTILQRALEVCARYETGM